MISGRSQYNKIDPVLTGQAARQDSPRYKTTARCFGWLEQNPAYWRDDASCQSDGVMKLFISRTSIITIEMAESSHFFQNSIKARLAGWLAQIGINASASCEDPEDSLIRLA